METVRRRQMMRMLYDRALSAIDPEPLTRQALEGREGPFTVVAIGKAAPAMCRGAAGALGAVSGICVAAHESPVPSGIELLIGDHPVPGESSFRAGRRVIEVVSQSRDPILALISGGGSALCEHPIPGVTLPLVGEITQRLLDSGTPIEKVNMVRSHLSAIKGGGLARIANQAIETVAVSDVCGSNPSVIASGPTSYAPIDPDGVLEVLSEHRIDLPGPARVAVEGRRPAPKTPPVTVIADGHTAAAAVVETAAELGVPAVTTPGWLRGPVDIALRAFFDSAGGEGLTVATGEVEVPVAGTGSGGRNTHTAVVAAQFLEGGTGLFAAFATDGIDGSSRSAGAIVDAGTIERGGVAEAAIAAADTARYLEKSGDLVVTGPTGTNVGDLWMLWR